MGLYRLLRTETVRKLVDHLEWGAHSYWLCDREKMFGFRRKFIQYTYEVGQ